MRHLAKQAVFGALLCCAGLAAGRQGEWSAPAEVRQDDALCLAYRARLDGAYLVVRAAIEPGWHTFAMDNKQRAEEKLAGKKALSVDRPTDIVLTGGLEAAGPWHQSPPKDFSKPEIRSFSWGFEREAVFAAKVRRSGTAATQVRIRGQACTDAICKNVDVTFALPAAGAAPEAGAAEIDLKTLVPVR